MTGRQAEIPFNLFNAIAAWLAEFPCNVIGHKLVEIPYSLRSPEVRRSGKLQFKCKRCPLISGARN